MLEHLGVAACELSIGFSGSCRSRPHETGHDRFADTEFERKAIDFHLGTQQFAS